MAVILITHDLGVVADIADRVRSCTPARSSRRPGATSCFDAPDAPLHRGLLAQCPASTRPRGDAGEPIPGPPPQPATGPPAAGSTRAAPLSPGTGARRRRRRCRAGPTRQLRCLHPPLRALSPAHSAAATAAREGDAP